MKTADEAASLFFCDPGWEIKKGQWHRLRDEFTARDAEHAALWAERTRLAREALAETACPDSYCPWRAQDGLPAVDAKCCRARAAFKALDGGTT